MSRAKQYILGDETKTLPDGTVLHRLICGKSFKNIKKGEKGGWIESIKNISGNAWVSGDARVYDDAWVSGNAWVHGNAQVYGDVKIISILCSRFSFEYQWQVDLWLKKEQEYIQEVEKYE